MGYASPESVQSGEASSFPNRSHKSCEIPLALLVMSPALSLPLRGPFETSGCDGGGRESCSVCTTAAA